MASLLLAAGEAELLGALLASRREIGEDIVPVAEDGLQRRTLGEPRRRRQLRGGGGGGGEGGGGGGVGRI